MVIQKLACRACELQARSCNKMRFPSFLYNIHVSPMLTGCSSNVLQSTVKVGDLVTVCRNKASCSFDVTHFLLSAHSVASQSALMSLNWTRSTNRIDLTTSRRVDERHNTNLPGLYHIAPLDDVRRNDKTCGPSKIHTRLKLHSLM